MQSFAYVLIAIDLEPHLHGVLATQLTLICAIFFAWGMFSLDVELRFSICLLII